VAARRRAGQRQISHWKPGDDAVTQRSQPFLARAA
jgi:hypothetical protein